MIIGGVLSVTPLFGPLGTTWHYLADFFAERPQSMRVPDISFFAEVLAANPQIVEEFKAGKEKAFNSLVGQAMKATKGKANPAQVNATLKRKLATL